MGESHWRSNWRRSLRPRKRATCAIAAIVLLIAVLRSSTFCFATIQRQLRLKLWIQPPIIMNSPWARSTLLAHANYSPTLNSHRLIPCVLEGVQSWRLYFLLLTRLRHCGVITSYCGVYTITSKTSQKVALWIVFQSKRSTCIEREGKTCAKVCGF